MPQLQIGRDCLEALKHYQWGPVSAKGIEPRKPLHNWASHGADAFRACATSTRQPERVIETQGSIA
jgi:hypothetical protein